MKRIIFHIDVNNAFLSWSAVKALTNGSKVDYRKVASVVGGDEHSRGGIVLAKSPVAKKLGVKTPEPIYLARKKCKNLLVIPPDYKLYEEMSLKFCDYLSRFSPLVEKASIDECYLDYTGMERLLGDPVERAYKIKDEIKEKFGFTVNIGVANNKLCAKMASDFSKPDKVHTLFDDEIEEKLWPLPIGELHFLGKVTAEKLVNLNVLTIGDLAHASDTFLKKYLKDNGLKLKQSALGIDNSKVIPIEEVTQKSISVSRTFDFDVNDEAKIFKMFSYLSFLVGKTLREKGMYTSVVSVVIRDSKFETYSKQKKLKKPINVTDDIYKEIKNLFKSVWKGEKVRLVGINLTDLSSQGIYQPSLFEKENKGNEKLQKVIDNLNKKYDFDILRKGE